MVFFDLDGTLLDSNGIWLDIDIAFLGRHGISPVPEDYTWYVTHHSAPDSARYTRERFGLAETAEEIQGAWLDMAREAYAGQLALKPGVRAFLERCREHGVPMAVLTSCIPELCRAALAHHRILDWFQGVVYAQETGIGKGEPELYRLAAERWGREPEEPPVRRPGGGNSGPVPRLGGRLPPGAGAPSEARLWDGRAACRERFDTVKQGRKKYLQFPEICDNIF